MKSGWPMRALVVLLPLALLASAGAVRSEPDRRTFRRVVRRSEPPREVSVYLTLPGEKGSGEGPRVPLWPGLSLRLVPLRHVEVRDGVFAYAVKLVSEKSGGVLLPSDQPAHGISADVVAAFHFRNRDNSGPNAPGPLNVNAPGELRIVRYPGVTLEIRVLSFEIVGAEPGSVPSFASLSLLVTAREVPPDEVSGRTGK